MLEALDTSMDADSHFSHSDSSAKSSTRNGQFPLNDHQKILHHVFHNFSLVELSRVARVCKVWRQVSDDDIQWKKFISPSDQLMYPGGKWKGLYLHKRREFLALSSQNPGIYVRLDRDSFVASHAGELSGEVVINVALDEALLGPITLRFVGYEESFGHQTVLADKVKDLEIGGFTEKNRWDRAAFPHHLTKGLHCIPFSMPLPRIDFIEGEPLPPSVQYLWDEDVILGSESFAIEYLVVAKADFRDLKQIKKTRPVTFTPYWDPAEKFARIRFCNEENVYTSRWPFANVKLKAALHAHPNVNDNNLDFEVLVEVENPGTVVSGPIKVTLIHTAVSGDFQPPELRAKRVAKEFPMNLGKSLNTDAPYKRKLEFSIPQRELWVDRIRGPPPAFASCLHILDIGLRISTFTQVKCKLPIEFLMDDQSNTEKEQDTKREVVQLE